MIRSLFLLLVFWLSYTIAGAREYEYSAVGSNKFKVIPVVYHSDTKYSFSDSQSPVKPSFTINLTALFLDNLSIAQLTWSGSDPSTAGTYYIERKEASSATWDILAQVPYNGTLSYRDTISYPYCLSTRLYYQIRFVGVNPADNAISNSVDEFLSDQTQPENVQNVVVSINNNSNPVITWNQVLGDDIAGYMICRFNGSIWPVYTTVPADSNSYTDLNADACDQSYYYVIIAKDKCGRESAPLYDTNYQRTIKLDLPHIDECERLAKLSWNAYNGMPGGLGGYKIFRSINYGTPVEVIDIPGSATTSYNDAFQFVNGQNYTYFVQAYSSSGLAVSNSCKQTRKYTGSAVPDSVYISKVSVVNDRYVRIDFHSLPDSTVKKMILERSDDGGIAFIAVDSISVLGDFVPEDFYFNDTTVNVHSQSYFYRLTALDYCGTKKIFSNISNTIYLVCSTTPTENVVDWNFYESWIKGVEGYKVFRTVEGQATVDSTYLLSSINKYTDPLLGVDPTKKVCYWVVAAEKPGNPYLANATSVSNTCCIIKGATLYMPNAFRPGGLNNRLRPVASFVDPQSFKMTIISRWGQVLFETTDMVNGWDGLINDQLAPPGLYAYIITYSSVGGQDYTKRGTVFVVR